MPKSNASINIVVLTFLAAALGLTAGCRGRSVVSTEIRNKNGPKLYWFVPDGFRADRAQFNIFEWAKQGKLPNLLRMMKEGCYGYSRPVFPGHTPVNFATLMTGTQPVVHGVADGSMRLLGHPLNEVAKSGFSSFARRVPAIWKQLEDAGSLVTLESIPGSTPPELLRGNTIKGRWGAWGVDFPSIIFQDWKSQASLFEMGLNRRAYGTGGDLTRFVKSHEATGWSLHPESRQNKTKPFEVNLANWGYALFGLVYRSDKATVEGYDRLLLSHDKKTTLADIQMGQWTEWLPVDLKYTLTKFGSSAEIATHQKFKAIRIGKNGEFRIRVLYDGLNEFMASPSDLAGRMSARLGPMVDYVDQFPPQLIYFPQDKDSFLEEADMSWQWHKRAVPFLARELGSDVVIQSIYTPNQMLTSRWWLPFVDKSSYRFDEKPEDERQRLFTEVKGMYKQADGLLGEILKATDKNWYVVLSSDHGALPLAREVRLNNLFAAKGWLKYRYDKAMREYEVDWRHTRVAFLQMNNIYINPEGLGGPYHRASSEAYYRLRNEVIAVLKELTDPELGVKVTEHLWVHEEAAQAGLPEDRVGDLVIANTPQYGWSEDLSRDGKVIVRTLRGGYKQAVWPQSAEGMLTPFVIMGPGIKHGCQLSEPIRHVDQFATLARLMGFKPPYKVDGRVLGEILEK